MAECEECKKVKCPPPGAPMWLATFADLMSLLMCFFVLLLSFSNMDIQKYKRAAGSMSKAFGVQRLVQTESIPKGTSIIAKHFSPGKPEPTVLKVVQQKTVENLKKAIERHDEDVKKASKDANKVAELLIEEIKDGKVDVESRGTKIIIRIREQASFHSGSSGLRSSFIPILEKIKMVLSEVKGGVTIAGHTDDIPISTDLHRSNWDLSSSRAVSVVHALLLNDELDRSRFSVMGHADTAPLVKNNSKKNREKNRRVEIIIDEKDKKKAPAKVIESDNLDGLPDIEQLLSENPGLLSPKKEPPK